MEALIKWGLGILAVLAAVAALVAFYDNWHDDIEQGGVAIGAQRKQGEWDADKIRMQRVALELVAKARKEEQDKAALAAKNAKVEYENTKVQAVAIARAAGVTSGMSRSIASLNADAINRGLPSAASCAGEFVRERDAGILARKLLDQCSSRYSELAATTDGFAVKLTTALSYISIVAPAAAAP